MNRLVVIFLCAGILTSSTAMAFESNTPNYKEYADLRKDLEAKLSVNQRFAISVSNNVRSGLLCAWLPMFACLTKRVYQTDVQYVALLAAVFFLNPFFVWFGNECIKDEVIIGGWAPEAYKEYMEKTRQRREEEKEEARLKYEFKAREARREIREKDEAFRSFVQAQREAL